jgi:O-methyltransferase involved in polyketide biosynthesis
VEPLSGPVLWAVTCRAHESRRANRVLDDPFASHLAAERGEELFGAEADGVASLVVAVATATVDEVLRRAIADYHVHAVADLCAGLDTRPYRLEVPSDLRWIEADRAVVLSYKALRLAHATPHCGVRHVNADLTDPDGRAAAAHEIAREVARGLVLSEALASTLERDALEDLLDRVPPVFQCWVVDTIAPTTPHFVSAQSTLSPDAIVDAFEQRRWRPVDFRPLRDQALRLLGDGRAAGLAAGGPRDEREGVWLFQRAG